MVFENLPGIISNKLDGNLGLADLSEAPKVLILGTASKGRSDDIFRVRRSQDANAEFGSPGTLLRGMFETRTAGAENILLFRLGATAAKLEHVGDSTGVAGITIETVEKDDAAGANVSIIWDDFAGRLQAFNAAGALIFDNNPADPAARIDIGEIIVSGSEAVGGGPDIGGPSAGVALKDVTATGTAFTAGTDGLNPSLMQQYENLYKAYDLLENVDFDIIIPMNVYLDSPNVIDQGKGATTITLPSANTYPVSGSTSDALGKFFVEEFEGEFHFFWDTNNDGDAEIWPLKGSASATTKINGDALTAADFHQVNFAYQLANFAFDTSENSVECTGNVGTLPPLSFSLKDVSNWIGTPPILQQADDGSTSIAGPSDNGTGLLGNQFLAGKFGFRSSAGFGGFIKTDSGFLDGTELKDENEHIVDMGKHINVVAQWSTAFTPFDSTGFGQNVNMATFYGGLYSTLPAQSAPTNKIVPNIRLPFRISKTNLDRLAKFRYVLFSRSPQNNIVVSDSPTAARPDSDYQRLSTMRIVKAVVDAVRRFGQPFIGEPNNPQQRAALRTVLDNALNTLTKAGLLRRYDLEILSTPADQVLGKAFVQLDLVPSFELRQLTVTLSLAAQ